LAFSVGKNQMCNLGGGFFFSVGFFHSGLVGNGLNMVSAGYKYNIFRV